MDMQSGSLSTLKVSPETGPCIVNWPQNFHNLPSTSESVYVGAAPYTLFELCGYEASAMWLKEKTAASRHGAAAAYMLATLNSRKHKHRWLVKAHNLWQRTDERWNQRACVSGMTSTGNFRSGCVIPPNTLNRIPSYGCAVCGIYTRDREATDQCTEGLLSYSYRRHGGALRNWRCVRDSTYFGLRLARSVALQKVPSFQSYSWTE